MEIRLSLRGNGSCISGDCKHIYRLNLKDINMVVCRHQNLTLLGSDKGNNKYYRCEDCGYGIIVTADGDMYQIPPKKEE